MCYKGDEGGGDAAAAIHVVGSAPANLEVFLILYNMTLKLELSLLRREQIATVSRTLKLLTQQLSGLNF